MVLKSMEIGFQMALRLRFEPGYEHQPEREFVSETVRVNGWQARAWLHGAVGDNTPLGAAF